MQTLALRAEYQHGALGVIHLVVILIAPLVHAVDPEPGFLEFFQCPVDIGDTRHWQVLESPRRGLGILAFFLRFFFLGPLFYHANHALPQPLNANPTACRALRA